MEKYFMYDLYDYEICGNEKDGFTANNCFHVESDIRLAESVVMDDKKLIQAMKKLGFIKKGIHTKSIEIDGEPEFTLYFNDVRHEVSGFCPAFELRCKKIVEE
jgi:hypothetical protein